MTTIKELVDKYNRERSHYISSNYNEMQLRNDFLNPLFELLGWDIKNRKKKPTYEREVILEEPLKTNISENTKKPDYTFRLFSERKFFLEAKKPGIMIEKNNSAAIQIRRYGFTGKVKISVLSNFEHLIIYDCSVPVEEDDNCSKGRINIYHYSEYEKKFEELRKQIGKESVYNGLFDQAWHDIENKIKLFSIDDLFLKEISEWRLLLGTEVFKHYPTISEEQLNDCVQSYLNSIVFLRVCEDRNLEKSETLLEFAKERNFEALIKKFKEADKKYNSGLFKIPLAEKIIGDVNSAFWEIINDLYYPESSYSFSVLSSDILGNIYETYLSEKLVIKENDDSDFVVLERKPENIDKDIITTPTYVIHDILRQSIIPFCEGKTDEEILKAKVCDISCGSGAFLFESYQLMNDLLVDYYLKVDRKKLIRTSVDTYKLTFDLKKKILLNCIFGVDKDYNAVEAAKFGLLIKLLEGENIVSTGKQSPVLPDLSNNIEFGNSLIGPNEIDDMDDVDKSVINPYDFKDNKYDIIIGNPPYMKSEDMKRVTPLEHPRLYKKLFKSAYKQFDKYFLFIEKGFSLLNENGYLGYIVPNKFFKVGAGKKLRRLLKESESLKRIISFGANQLFKSKTTYTCQLILEKSRNENCGYYEVKNLSDWKVRLFNENDFEFYSIPSLDDDVWIFVPSYLKGVYNKINAKSIPLVEFLGKENIFNGIQTSMDSIYIIIPGKEDKKYIYFNKGDITWKVEKELSRPYYQTPRKKDDNRLNTYRLLEPNSLVIFPYRKSDEGIEIIPEKELKQKYLEAYKYFNYHKPRLLKRNVSPPMKKDDWYKFGRSQNLNRWDSPEKIVIGVNSVGNKYAIDYKHTFISSGGTAGHCGITLPPDKKYSLLYIQALLNSKYLEWYSSLMGEIFRGGYIARGTKVLNKLPIRKIDFNNPDDVILHDKIAEIQENLINKQSEIDNNRGNTRVLIKLKRQFNILKDNLNRKLKELYKLKDDDKLIPLIEEIYEAN
ncbi:Eco57I restriction-modification methylase domain-containing protein [Acidobacteriota bacterium]